MTFEEKYNEKLKNKVSGVEFTNSSLNDTINDFKNNVNHLKDLKQLNEIGPEEKKFNEWLEFEKRENGLIDFKVTKAFDSIDCNKDDYLNIHYVESNYTKEDYFRELNYINEAKTKGLCKPIIYVNL